MGWMGSFDHGQTALAEGREYVRRNSASVTCPWPWKIVKDAEVKTRNYNRGVYYAALEHTGTGERFIFVMLCQSHRGEFLYKDLEESAIPEAKCPIEVIEAAGPTKDANAIKWRRMCYRHYHSQMPDYNQLKLF